MPRRYNKMQPLTKKAERALRGTIKQWEVRASGKPVDEYCPLCVFKSYSYDFPIGQYISCKKCPVVMRFGMTCFCSHSFVKYRSAVIARRSPDYANPHVTIHAKRVLRFLRDTLRLGLKARERD